MPDTTWRRQCALCGALDADHAYAAPDDDGAEPWSCHRCEAIRFLWHPVLRPSARAERRRVAG
ncbi:MAG TPA: hypothetical protein VF288_04665 [Mycobacteriales bacterium]